MSHTVWKYPLPPTDVFAVDLPAGAEVLHVEQQRDTVCMWALVDPDQPLVRHRRFRLVGTGHPIPEPTDARQHVGSFLVRGGAFVFHLFELTGPLA
jgi:hypothetical protein